MAPVEKLQKLLSGNKVIPVIGAGVSASVAGLPGWKGLLEDAIRHCENIGIEEPGLNESRQLLADNNLLDAAEIIKKLLNAPGHPFVDWLDETFGYATIKSRELLVSISNLCPPLFLTTNYDDIIDSYLRIKAIDWSDQEQTQRLLNRHEQFVLHLHGIHDRPGTIILSRSDYQKLNVHDAYKFIITKLISDHHFLFIGCSKDGVFDEDFRLTIEQISKWFPSVPHQHFILLNDREKTNKHDLELLRFANIQPVFYGSDYSLLPKFIDSFNPNKEKALDKLRNEKRRLEEDFSSLLEEYTLEGNDWRIEEFIKNELPGKSTWIGSPQLEVLDKVLHERNKAIQDKKQVLLLYQGLIRGLVSTSELKGKVDLWVQKGQNPKSLGPMSFINTAILAYECLERLPKNILHDIERRKPWAVHPYYVTGELDYHINIFRRLKSSKRFDAYEAFNDDPYFFENLKRIIDSLLGLLTLNAEEVYSEIDSAIVAPNLQRNFLIVITASGISLADPNNLYTIYAHLPTEKGLPIRTAVSSKIDGKEIIIGFTSQYAFTWDPQKDSSANIFYEVHDQDYLLDIYISTKKNSVLCYIREANLLSIFEDFKIAKRIHYNIRLVDAVFLKASSDLIGITAVFSNTSKDEAFLHRIDQHGNVVPLLTTEQAFQIVEELPSIKSGLDRDDTEFEKLLYPFISLPKIKLLEWQNEQIFGVAFRIQTSPPSTIILLFRFRNGQIELLHKCHTVGRLSIAFDLLNDESRVHLCIGYLDNGHAENLVQFVANIHERSESIVTSGLAAISSQYNSKDILSIWSFSEKIVFANQNNEVVHRITYPACEIQRFDFDEKERVFYVDR